MASNTQLHRADLDRNDTQDLVIWQGVSGNGLAPNAFLILMIFNQQDHPCVFQSDGSYTASETGIGDLLDLQRDGHTRSPDIQFGSGYWITSLYQAKDTKWQHIHGWFGGLSCPVLTRFTYTPNRELVLKPIAGCDLQTGDLMQAQRCLVKRDVLYRVNQS